MKRARTKRRSCWEREKYLKDEKLPMADRGLRTLQEDLSLWMFSSEIRIPKSKTDLFAFFFQEFVID